MKMERCRKFEMDRGDGSITKQLAPAPKIELEHNNQSCQPTATVRLAETKGYKRCMVFALYSANMK
jgi:hypothetical protein